MTRLALWGCHKNDYKDRFDLIDQDCLGSILEYGCGVSAFNYELQGIAKEVISCDPWFSLDLAKLTSIVRSSFAARVLSLGVMAETPEAKTLINHRKAGIDIFLADYLAGKAEGRYLADMQLTQFTPFHFDLALSHQFFFWADAHKLNLDEHMTRLFALTHIAKEVRLFPLNDSNGKPSDLLGPVLLALQKANYGVEIRTVRANFQAQGNAMLRIFANVCELDY